MQEERTYTIQEIIPLLRQGCSFVRELEGDNESGTEHLYPGATDTFFHEIRGNDDHIGEHGGIYQIPYKDLKYTQWNRQGWTLSSE